MDESWKRPQPVGPSPRASRIRMRPVIAVGDEADGLPGRAPRRSASRPAERPRPHLGERLARRRRPTRCGGLGPGPVGVGEALAHLVAREPLPLAEAHLAEGRRAPARRAGAARRWRRRCRGRGASGLDQTASSRAGREQARRRLRLLPAGGRQRRRPSSPGTGAPGSSRSPRDAAAGCAWRSPRSAKTFWAARTPAPKSTGCPSSCSTCSSAARAVTTSNSADVAHVAEAEDLALHLPLPAGDRDVVRGRVGRERSARCRRRAAPPPR